MALVQTLSFLAWKRLDARLPVAAGDDFPDLSAAQQDALDRALRNAAASAWLVFEAALAGESLWDRIDAALAPEPEELAARCRVFLITVWKGLFRGTSPRFRQRCLQE